MEAVATLVLLGFIALGLTVPGLWRALTRGATPDNCNEKVRKLERWTLIFEVGFALAAWAAAGLLHLSNIDFSAAATGQLLKILLAVLLLVGLPGIYGYLIFRQWRLRRQFRGPDGALSAEDARRIGSLDKLKDLILAMMALSLLLLLVMR